MPRVGSCQTLGGRSRSSTLVGVSRAWGQHNHPSTEDTPSPTGSLGWRGSLRLQQLGYPWRGGKKKDADKQFHREHSTPLILSPHTAVQQPRGFVPCWVPLQGAPTAPQLSIPLALYCDRRSRGGRLLPLLQPLPFQMSPPILELYMGKRPSSCHSFLAQTKSALLSSRIQHGAIYHMRKRYPPLAEATRGVECVPRHQGLDPRALTCTGSKLESWSRALGGSIAAPVAGLKHSPHT